LEKIICRRRKTMYSVDIYTIIDREAYSYQISFVDDKGKVHERSYKREINASKNQKELYAIIDAVKVLKSRCNIKIHTESSYIVSAINQWLEKWQQSRFINAKGVEVKNKELWQGYILLTLKHNVEVIKENGSQSN